MQLNHRTAILRSLGIHHVQDRMMIIDAKEWGYFKRQRTFFSSLPAPHARWAVPMRDIPWDDGWEVRAAAPGN
eukprot:15672662-Heterocapsa_arctica.AAC.1